MNDHANHDEEFTPNRVDDSSSHDGQRGYAPSPLQGTRRREIDLACAWEELIRVHELEQARLLREACRLRRTADARASSPCKKGTDDGRPDRFEIARALWRRRAEEALALALADGLEPPACLRFCAAHAFDRWPSSEALAEASLLLEDCASARSLLR